MSSKINVTYIIKQHFNTLRDAASGKVSLMDILVFICLPVIFGGIVFVGQGLSKDIFSLAVNFGAISTALLMSVLVLVYDQESKINLNMKAQPNMKDHYEAKLSVLADLYQNICYTIVASICLVIFSVIGMAVLDESIRGIAHLFFSLSSALVAFLFSNIVITMLMVIKRFHALLTH